MKRSPSEVILHTNILRAMEKNKIIQAKLAVTQHSYDLQLSKDIENYQTKVRFYRDLLHTWDKESNIRRLRKDLRKFEQNNYDLNSPYYEYTLRNLDNIISGEHGLIIPPREEERRLNVKAKYRQFLQQNPVERSSTSTRLIKSAIISMDQYKSEDEDEQIEEIEEKETIQNFEKNRKHLHAQSAIGIRRKQNKTLPNIYRPKTTDENRRNRLIIKKFYSSNTDLVSTVLAANTRTPHLLTDEKRHPSPTKLAPSFFELPDDLEPILITSETLDPDTRADLETMRSVRRPKKNAKDLNLIYETRKRICHINKRALGYQLCQRRCQLQSNNSLDRQTLIE